MELCVITSTTTITPFHSFLFGGWPSPVNPLEGLSCVSRKIGFLEDSTSHGGGFQRFAASSAVEASVKEDRLPADLKVNETVEANSGVKLSVEVPAIVCEDCYQRVLTEFMKLSKEGNRLLPGFLDSILGTRAGESKSFSLVFPESWKQENLRGQRAQFTESSSAYTRHEMKVIRERSYLDKLIGYVFFRSTARNYSTEIYQNIVKYFICLILLLLSQRKKQNSLD